MHCLCLNGETVLQLEPSFVKKDVVSFFVVFVIISFFIQTQVTAKVSTTSDCTSCLPVNQNTLESILKLLHFGFVGVVIP